MTKLSDDLIRPRTAPEGSNRARVLAAIPIAGKGMTIDEIARKTRLDPVMVIACVWLDSNRLTAAHDPDNPIEIRWRKDE